MTGKVKILDGGMGRELKRIGAPFRQPECTLTPRSYANTPCVCGRRKRAGRAKRMSWRRGCSACWRRGQTAWGAPTRFVGFRVGVRGEGLQRLLEEGPDGMGRTYQVCRVQGQG